MSLLSHLDALKAKHTELDRRIEEQARYPASDEMKIKDLKKQKLQIKEEIERAELELSA